MEIIQFATADDHRSWFIYCVVFATAVGAIIGGVWEQDVSEEQSFWPKSFKRIVVMAMFGGLVGVFWGNSSSLDVVYKIECRDDSLALWKSGVSEPEVIKKSDIDKVRPGLSSARGQRAWEIHLYEKSGELHSSSRVSDVESKKFLEELKRCLSRQ